MRDVKRIAIFGTESTGKTSLAERLALHFGEPWSREFAREFWDSHAGTIAAADLDVIARGQIADAVVYIDLCDVGQASAVH